MSQSIGPAMPPASARGAAAEAAAAAAATADKADAPVGEGKKPAHCMRKAAGKIWYDESLDEYLFFVDNIDDHPIPIPVHNNNIKMNMVPYI